MTHAIDIIGNTAQRSLDFVHNELGVSAMWVPEGAGELATSFSAFGMALTQMHELAHDPNRRFFRVPTAPNVTTLQGQQNQLVAIETTDERGESGLFPAIILPPGKVAGQLRFGVLNTAPYQDSQDNMQPGDRLPAGGAPSSQQAFSLYLMGTKEARGAGAHDRDGRASASDIVHGGVALGVAIQPSWGQNTHGKVHELAGTAAHPGTGTSAGLSQAGLTSVTGHSSEKVVVNPRYVYWNPSFVEIERPPEDLLRQYAAPELVMAVGVASLEARKLSRRNLKTQIAAGIAAVKKSLAI